MSIERQNRGYLVAALIVGVGIVAALLVVITGPSANPVETTGKAWPVSSMVVEPTSLAPHFSTWAEVQSGEIANLRAALDAPVASVEVRPGDRVVADQILVRLVDRDQQLVLKTRQADLAAATAALGRLTNEEKRLQAETAPQRTLADIAKNKLARYQSLFDEGMVAQSLLDEVRREASERTINLLRHDANLADLPHRRQTAEAQVEQARAAVAVAQLNIDRTLIRAPFAGPVLEVTAGPGDQLPGLPLLRMANEQAFELRATLPARHRNRLRDQLDRGLSIIARMPTGDDAGGFPLVRIGTAMRPGQGGLDGYFAVPPEFTSELELGRVMDLEVRMPPEDDVIAIPMPALFEDDRVYRISVNRLQAVTVERIGEYRDGNDFAVLIRSPDLKQGERLLTTALPNAISGLLVAPGADAVTTASKGEEVTGVDEVSKASEATTGVDEVSKASEAPEADST